MLKKGKIFIQRILRVNFKAWVQGRIEPSECRQTSIFIDKGPILFNRQLCHPHSLFFHVFCSINPSTNQIELSLRGPDVKDKDPAPPPKKRQRTESEQSDSQTKRERKDSTGLQIELRSNESGTHIS